MSRHSLYVSCLCGLVLGCSPADKQDAAQTTPDSVVVVEPSRDQPSTGEFDRQFPVVNSGDSAKLQLVTDRVTSEQLVKLAASASVLDLLIDAGGVVDSDMKIIGQLKELEHLRIRQSPLTDAAISLLAAAELPSLEILNLPQARITAAGIRSLRTLPSLKNLRLGGDQIDDAAVAEIAQLPALRSLHLIGPNITGSSLRSLAQAPKLTSFYLDDCELPGDDWNVLFAAKPNLHVHVDQHHLDRDLGKHEH